MRKSIRFKSLVVFIAAGLTGIAAPSVWSQASASDTQGTAGSGDAAQSIDAPYATYMIYFMESGALEYRGGVADLRATAPADTGERFNAKRPEAIAYRRHLESLQSARIADMRASLGRNVEVPHTYQITHSGIAAKLTAAEAAEVAAMSGVRLVERDKEYQLDTFRGPSFIGAQTVWGAAVPTPATAANFGKGVVIGVLDSGVNATHPSFANDVRCGFGPSDAKLRSFVDCSASAAGVCTGVNPLDTNGHGTHTASTSGGNVVGTTAVPPPVIPAPYTQISGVAPCATVRTYKVCPGTTCPGADITAGLSNILIDGDVDVVNYSISGGNAPWSAGESDRAFLDFVNTGIFVAASAGNTRAETPNPVGLVNHLGPWVMTVASSTHDENPVGGTLSADGPGTPPANTQNLALSVAGVNVGTSGIYPIRFSPTNDIGCTATGGFPAGFFTGAVALIPRGTCSFEEKLNNAQAAGALVGFVYNNAAGALNMAIGTATIPSYALLQADGLALRAFITSNGATPTTVDFEAAVKQGDLLSDFSLRGPTSGGVADLTKPDITAPGDNIYAAVNTPTNYGYLGGTSMSSPHVAGAAALVAALRPSWTPMAIKSALQMTAKRTGVQEDGTTQWTPDQVGNGRVQVDKAIAAGLVMEETTANFLAANPVGGTINVKALNLPAVRNVACTPNCTFTRTVTSRLATASTWNVTFDTASEIAVEVTPSTFTLAPGASQTLTIVASVLEYGPNLALPNPPGSGAIVLTEAAALSPPQHMTVAVRGPRDGIFKHGFEGPPASGVTVDYGFEVVANLFTAGWFQSNQSEPLGASTYAQGANAGLQPAQAGAIDSFALVNFNSTTGTGTISNWMLTPVITFNAATSMSFYTRTLTGSSFPDRLEVRVSSAGASTNVGTGSAATGDFGTLLTSVNPALTVGGYPQTWTQFTVDNASGIPTSGTGRIAFRYSVTGGGPAGANSNIIGIDSVQINAQAVASSGSPAPAGNSTPIPAASASR